MRCATLFLALVLSPSVALSSTYYVPDDYNTIQEAINAVSEGDTIIVRSVLCHENIDFMGKAITVKSENGPDFHTIDGDQKGTVVTFSRGEGLGSRLEGFTVTNAADYGIYCYRSSPTISGNTISGNTSHGVYCYAYGSYGASTCSPVVANNEISLNSGDGIRCYAHTYKGTTNTCSPIITKNIIADNLQSGIECEANAAGAWENSTSTCSPIITNNGIYDNLNGGISCSADSCSYSYTRAYCSPMIINNVVVSNQTDDNGGGITCTVDSSGDSCSPMITNNTISGNSAAGCGGGVFCSGNSRLTIKDTILWINNAPLGQGIYVGSPSTFSISYSDVDGGLGSVFNEPGSVFNWGPGMIDADPMFITGPDGDYYLEQNPPQAGATSPCVDSGSDTAENLGMDTAWTRTDEVPDSGIVDMGFHYGQPSNPTTEWAILVYLNGDNNLEAAALDDFIEMAQVGSMADFNIIVQLDRHPFDENFPDPGYSSQYGDWWDTRRFVISSGMTPDDGNEIINLGEANMGQGPLVTTGDGSLEDFVRWASENCPARKTALVLWDHGDGWRGDRPRFKSAGYDMTNNDYLYMAEVRQALENAALAGYAVDLLGFDSCLMGMLEVAYEIRDLADVMVGSEMVEPDRGWPYDTILTELAADPQVGASALAKTIVTEYGLSEPNYTMSALDLSKVESLASAVSNLALEMTTNKTEIATARAQTRGYDAAGGLNHIDLYDFAYQILLEVPPGNIYTAAVDVMNVLLQVVIECHGDPILDNGLAIYFPEVSSSFSQEYNEDTILFANDLYWDEFLHWYYDNILLYCTGDVIPGGPIEIRVVGPSGEPVLLALGIGIQDPPQSTTYGDLYLILPVLWQANLGTIPANGILIFPGTVPSSWQTGDEYPIQALVGPIGNPNSSLTNLVVLTVQ